MKSVKENYPDKSSLTNFQNPLPYQETYVKYLEENSIAIGIVIAIFLAFFTNLL